MFKYKESPKGEEIDEQLELKQTVLELESFLADQWLNKVKAKERDFIKYPQERNSWFTRSLLVLQNALKYLTEDSARSLVDNINALIFSIKKSEEEDTVYVKKITRLIKLALIELKD